MSLYYLNLDDALPRECPECCPRCRGFPIFEPCHEPCPKVCEKCNGTGKLPAREPDVSITCANGEHGWVWNRVDVDGKFGGPYPTEHLALDAARRAGAKDK